MKSSKTVGVLGGMGPYATAAFFQKLVSLTPATRDWEHLRIVVDDNPHIPSRSRHLLYGEPSPLPGMVESCVKLQAYPVDFIAIPCNSAAIFVPELQRELQVPVLNICEIAANAVADAEPAAVRVAVLGSRVTYRQRTYEPFLSARDRQMVEHDEQIQVEIERLIESLKLGHADDSHMSAVDALTCRLNRDYGAQSVILACTEFGCLPSHAASLPMIDSSLELARHAVALARS